MAAYALSLTDEEIDAVNWHGGRYEVSEILCKALVQEEDGRQWFELEEVEMWALREAWEEEGPLSCGSAQLNQKLQEFIDFVVQ